MKIDNKNNNSKPKRVLIAAGGTGGHVFPALAIATALQQQGVEVQWLGTRHGLESQLVPAAKIPLHYLSVRGIRRNGWFALFKAPLQILKAAWQALRLIREIQPDFILGLGGFVSGPSGIAAWLLRKPLLIHEQNAIPGFTNRCLAHFADKIFQAFPNTFKQQQKVITVGNPIRGEIAQIASPRLRLNVTKRKLNLLVLGGSQGAAKLNQIVPQALLQLESDCGIEVWHQAGQRHIEVLQENYRDLTSAVKLAAFIDDMAAAYNWADLVLCRAGALTIAELATVGVASILVPYPYAVDDHQTKNGMHLVNVGAAIMLQEAELNPDKLAQTLRQLMTDKSRLLQMAEAAHTLSCVDATNKLIKLGFPELC